MTEQEKAILLEWELFLKNITVFVQVAKVNGIKFEIRTNEQGHNRPHLHVSTSSASMSIEIDNGDILAFSGKVSPAQRKMAQDWIGLHNDLVISKWNEFSNGIEIQTV